MAIDTRNKRASAIGIGLPWRAAYPLADGTIDQADRQHVALLYAGILASTPEEIPVIPSRVIRLVAGGGVLHRVAAGGCSPLPLRAGGGRVKRLPIGTN